MFFTPETLSEQERRVIMSMTPETMPPPTFAQLSLIFWIQGECKELRRVLENDLLLLLRMYFKVEKGVEVASSKDNIKRSLERLRVHDIYHPNDVHRHMRRLIAEIAQHYAKEVPTDEVDILIARITLEPNPCNYANYVSDFFNRHFPKYSFE
jgi:hypothetical protein